MKNLFNPIGFTMLAGLLASIPIYAVEVKSMKNVSVTQQQKKLTGRVTDSLGPVVGASVAIKGTTSGTITDMDGNFTLDVQVGDEISISYIGYATQTIKYTGQENVTVLLKEDSQQIDEVVVTAMGIKKEKRALSY